MVPTGATGAMGVVPKARLQTAVAYRSKASISLSILLRRCSTRSATTRQIAEGILHGDLPRGGDAPAGGGRL